MDLSLEKGGSLLERQLSIVEAVLASRDGMYLNEIAKSAGLPAPTAHRIIGSLIKAGLLVHRTGGRKVYVIGPRAARLLHSGAEIGSIRRTVGPVLQDAVDRLHETVYLARLHGLEVGAIAMVAPTDEGRGYVDPGRKLVPHAAASAKAIVAFQTPDLVNRILRPPLTRFTPFTVIDIEAVRADYEEVRRRGFAVCNRELHPATIAYACPIFVDGIGVFYSIGATGTFEGMAQHSTESIVSVLQSAAARIAGLLSLFGNPDHRKPWDGKL